ncbi:DUF4198 domain-containing protein [Blastochloris sulfoviridis]|uniref:DUF4198 domain-containing protein n=1 Tax=Blastochloris sulfoviridis TaxID=50712 RepID=A0A5M6I2Q8_9HYPH|nr:DUF4198 domain-containing protein [Blastochloris sulfoviridis]KAA5602169.1 DUF4198 domain-containing protein [Blastochloris sulfoviridis]NJL08529.1 DUF4198 domain-containing protein [Candidatus Methylacidiphilales bacterium]
MKTSTVLAAGMLLAAASAAQAHFQLAYTPDVNLEKPAAVPMKFIFWHPLENGHVMDMGEPEALVLVFKGEKTDLKSKLKPITFRGADNEAKAFEAVLDIKRNGDYIVALTPKPYFEKSEGSYIQQITKSFLNKGGIPDGWDKPVGLPTEIVPLVKPTNVLAGSTFSGVVLSEGKPVADAEIEVEYMAAPPDMKANKPGKVTVKAPEGGAIVVKTDSNGVFSFGVPRAGFWGFAALGSGPAKEFEGKELSQDAVIWIRAFDFK